MTVYRWELIDNEMTQQCDGLKIFKYIFIYILNISLKGVGFFYLLQSINFLENFIFDFFFFGL